MEYIKPRKTGGRKVQWNVSPATQAVVKYYAQYSGYTEDEIVDMYLIQMRDDPDFQNWLKKLRRNKRAIDQIYSDSVVKEETIV